MKKIFTRCFVLAAVACVFFNPSKTFATGGCVPNVNVTQGMLPLSANVACVQQGVAYSQSFTFVVPNNALTVPILSLTIDSVGNLPAGLSYSTDATPATYAADSSGCINIYGTTNAPCGQYQMPVYVTFVVQNIGNVKGELSALTAQYSVPGFVMTELRVYHPLGTCPAVVANQSVPFIADAGCGLSGICVPNGVLAQGLSPVSDSVPCIQQGQGFSQAFSFVVPATASGLTITNMHIDSIGNLPSGMFYAANVSPADFAGGTRGCFIISGTTNAPCGQYKMPVYVTFSLQNFGNISGELSALAAQNSVPGFPMHFLRIVAPGGACPAVDSTQTTDFVLNPNCAAGNPLTVQISTTPVQICFGDSSSAVIATATGGTLPYTYSWSNGATTNSIAALPAGFYTVSVNDGASNTATDTITIVQNTLISTTVIDSACVNDTYLFNGQNVTAPGNYQAVLTAQNGCDSVVNLNLGVETCVGINTPSAEALLSVYPNPANTQTTVYVNQQSIGSTATLTDMPGKKVMTFHLAAQYYLLNTSSFANGVYFLTIENEHGKATRKLIIQQ